MEKELESILEIAADAATDIVVARVDVKKTDADYDDRRRYAREKLSEYLCMEAME